MMIRNVFCVAALGALTLACEVGNPLPAGTGDAVSLGADEGSSRAAAEPAPRLEPPLDRAAEPPAEEPSQTVEPGEPARPPQGPASQPDEPAERVEDETAIDTDGDGEPDATDCQPEDALVHPGADELCNGVDDDCDGELDPGFGVGAPCLEGVGECRAAGTIVCLSDIVSGCDAVPSAPSPELCDLLDNDCDGVADDGLGLGEPCKIGIGGCAAKGLIVCLGDGEAGCDATPFPPTEESCDGLDNDCDGEVDNGFGLGEPCSAGQGTCQVSGVIVCGDIGSTCDAVAIEPIEELCDLLDNDCDGETDEDLGVGQACSAGSGECETSGTLVCAGNEVVCDAQPFPSTVEICDGFDNDCNGEVDDGFGLGEPCTEGLGPCQVSGVIACGLTGPTCDAVSTVQPVAELCDAVDNDCDGEVDEDFSLGDECTLGTGGCESQGVVVCTEDGHAMCDALPLIAAPEACDGLDNDCDGAVDEGFDVGVVCEAGTGACHDQGAIVCAADGTAICTAQAGAPSAELCDGIDNDCDGSADEDFGLGAGCSDGIGACYVSGHIACTAQGTSACNVTAGTPTFESCDGVDNDCDGSVDESFPLGAACSVGIGACHRTGSIVCSGGGAACSASPGAPTGEICDGEDNNCNGAVDDGLGLGAGCTVGIGQCTNSGSVVCNGSGGTQCSVGPKAPQGEACDNVDNDCDGVVDEGVKNACGYCGGVPSEVCDGTDNDCDGAVDEGDVCGCSTLAGPGGTYLLCTGQNKNHAAAQGYCNARGYHLAVIDNAGENGWLASKVSGSSGWWIGGGGSGYGNWLPNHPKSGKCPKFKSQGNKKGKWETQSCNYSKKYVCEHN